DEPPVGIAQAPTHAHGRTTHDGELLFRRLRQGSVARPWSRLLQSPVAATRAGPDRALPVTLAEFKERSSGDGQRSRMPPRTLAPIAYCLPRRADARWLQGRQGACARSIIAAAPICKIARFTANPGSMLPSEWQKNDRPRQRRFFYRLK